MRRASAASWGGFGEIPANNTATGNLFEDDDLIGGPGADLVTPVIGADGFATVPPSLESFTFLNDLDVEETVFVSGTYTTSLGGTIEVVIPAADYADRIPDHESRARFDRFMAQAQAVHEMPYEKSGSEAYLAASKMLIRRGDIVMAVWDGTPADGKGGTADAVKHAKDHNREVLVVWPAGATRG